MPSYRGQTHSEISNLSYNQETGLVERIIIEGQPDDVEGRLNDLASRGYDAEIQYNANGPYAVGIAARTYAAVDYPYVERWSIHTELIQKPIWGLPAVKAAADDFPPVPLAGNPADFKKGIEEAIADGKALPATYTGTAKTVADAVMIELSRGAEAYEHDYTVLTRTVNFEFDEPPPPLVFESNRYIYTTDQLRTNEQIPSDVLDVLFSLPSSDPGNNTQSLWGWRVREQNAEITNSTTGTHTTSWVYADWSTFLYTPAT